ncbi:MAG: M28 family peptidase [Sulfolobales archaeon]
MMRDRDLYKEILEKYLLRERVSGWAGERDYAYEIRDILCDNMRCDSSQVISINVRTWEDLFCEINTFRCAIQPPYEGDISLKGVLTDNIEHCEDKILLISTTDHPDNIWVLYNEAVERRARGVVFYDFYPFRRRRIVVSGRWSYSFNETIRAEVPVVHISLEEYARLRRFVGREIDLVLRSKLRSSTGFNVEVIKEHRDQEIIVSAHHDAWLSGFRDNGIGVLTLIRLSEVIGRRSFAKNSVRIVSLTAEEYGDPSNSTWYWAYGSRVYVNTLSDEYIERRKILGLVLDLAYREPLKISYTSPDIAFNLKHHMSIESQIDDYGHVYMDTISFVSKGVPTLTLHNFTSDVYSIYHTDLDLPFAMWRGFIERLSLDLARIIDRYDPATHMSVKILRERIRKNTTGDLRVKLEELIGEIERRDIDAIYRFYKCFSKTLLKPVAFESYRKLYSELSLTPYPEIISIASRIGSREVIVAGEERTLDFGNEFLKNRYLAENLELLEMLRECVFR